VESHGSFRVCVYDCCESDDLLYFDGIDMEKWELSSQIKGPVRFW